MAGGESTNPSRPNRGHKIAAMLIDFENVAIPLEKTVAVMLNTIQSLLKWLETEKKCEVGENHAFADWRTYPISMGKLSEFA